MAGKEAILPEGSPPREREKSSASLAGGSPRRDSEESLQKTLLGVWRALGVAEGSSDISEGLSAQLRRQRNRLGRILNEPARRQLRKVVTGSESKRVRDHLLEKRREPKIVRFLDKISFVAGVVMIMTSEFFLLAAPADFWLWYAAVMPILLFARFLYYKKNKWQYFLLDFCYYVQASCLLGLLLWPKSCRLLKVNFVYANGPLAWAVYVWRNSLVFHDFEKMTSVYVHILPGWMLLTVRWYSSVRFQGAAGAGATDPLAAAAAAPAAGAALAAAAGAAGAANGVATAAGNCSSGSCGAEGIGFVDMGWALLGYLAWQLAYFYKTEVVDRARLDADPEMATSLRWLTRDTKSAMYRLVRSIAVALGIMRPDESFDHRATKTKVLFMTSQLVYTFATMVLSPLLYRSFKANLAYLLAIFALALWNGSSYFIEIFSQRYWVSVQGQQQQEGPGRGTIPATAVAAGAAASGSDAGGSGSNNSNGDVVVEGMLTSGLSLAVREDRRLEAFRSGASSVGSSLDGIGDDSPFHLGSGTGGWRVLEGGREGENEAHDEAVSGEGADSPGPATPQPPPPLLPAVAEGGGAAASSSRLKDD